jgi:hypothetical protein
LRPRRILIVATVLLLCAGGSALAVKNGEGDLVVSFDGGIRPTDLPRKTPVPVAVRVGGDIESASGDTDHLPQLQVIEVAINRQGRLFDLGLPVCSVRAIQPATEANARRSCGDAIVGSGHVIVQARIPAQRPFLVRARVLAFNGPRRNGHKAIFVQAYARTPPGAFVLTFRVSRRKGVYGTVLTTTLSRGARNWAYLTHFDLTLRRIFDYHGRRRSFVSAACAAPRGFDSVLFPFAKATYRFDTGQELTLSETARCRVAS